MVGPYGISYEAWKYGSDVLLGALTKVLNRICRGENFPERWRTGVVKPVYKKESKKLARNYRLVTLMDTRYKLYAEILRARMAKDLGRGENLERHRWGLGKGEGR